MWSVIAAEPPTRAGQRPADPPACARIPCLISGNRAEQSQRAVPDELAHAVEVDADEPAMALPDAAATSTVSTSSIDPGERGHCSNGVEPRKNWPAGDVHQHDVGLLTRPQRPDLVGQPGVGRPTRRRHL
jgi:hypothetical protein